jgi:hypothetical protein
MTTAPAWFFYVSIAGTVCAWLGCCIVWVNYRRTRRYSKIARATYLESLDMLRKLRSEAHRTARLRLTMQWIAMQPRPTENADPRTLVFIIGRMQAAAARTLELDGRDGCTPPAANGGSVVLQ